MKQAVIIGAGSIGRGFIGQLFSDAGWSVCFLDVAAPLVDALNAAGEYPLDIVSNRGTTRRIIAPVRAVSGRDSEAAARVTADADVCVTCVGAKALKFIVPNLAAGVRLRHAEGGGPLNLLICENLMDADAYLRGLLEQELTPEEMDSLGLVETSVGRMVPLPDPKLTEREPLLVRAERYGVLPYDRDAWKGELPDVGGLMPFSPFRFAVERKLWIHNMGHAVCAYLGLLRGYTTIAESIGDPAIRVAVREAMISSARALAGRYGEDLGELLEHSEDLIRRFGNQALGDTCARVGNDVPRKLAKSDRLTGAALSVIEDGRRPVWLSLGAAAAYREYEKEGGDAAFEALTGVDGGAYRDDAMRFYRMVREGKSVEELIRSADEMLEV